MRFRTVDSDGAIVSWWNVSSLGDYGADCSRGREYASEYIQAVIDGDVHTALPHIVAAFPKPLTGVEISFLQQISESFSLLT